MYKSLSNKRGMAVPIAMVVVLFLSTLLVGGYWMSRTQMLHTSLAKDRVLASYLSESGHNTITNRIIKEGWNNLWYKDTDPDKHEEEITEKLSMKSQLYAYIKDVPAENGSLDRIEIYSKGIHNKTAQLYYQELAFIPAPPFDRSGDYKAQDVKITNRFKITSGDIDENLEKANLKDEEVRKKIKQAVVDKIEIIIKEHAQKQSETTGEEDVDGESGRKAETEYLARKGREIFKNDQLQILVGKDGKLYTQEESIKILFGEATDGNGLFRQNTVDPDAAMSALAKAVSSARLYYSVLFERETTDDKGEADVEQMIAKAETSVPLYLQYGDRKDQDGLPLTVPLDEYLLALTKTVNVKVDPPATGLNYSVPKPDETKYNGLEGKMANENSEFVRTYNLFDGFKLGNTNPITGNANGANTVKPPGWAPREDNYDIIEPPRDTVAFSVEEGQLKESKNKIPTATTAIADAKNTGNAQDANNQITQALNAGLITPQQANQQRTTINNYYNINQGNTGQTGQTGAAQGAVAGAEAGAAGTGNGLNYCPVPAEGENPPGFFERFLTGPGANAAGYVAGGTLAVAGFPLGLLAAGPVKNAVSNAIKDFGEKYGPGLDQKASAVKNAAVNTVNTVTNTANNVKDAVFGLFSKNKDQDDN